MDQQTFDTAIGYFITSGLALMLVLWLLMRSKKMQAGLSSFCSWLQSPSQADCKKVSDEMLARMDAAVEAKKVAGQSAAPSKEKK